MTDPAFTPAQFIIVNCPACDDPAEVPADNKGIGGPVECGCGHVFWYDARAGVIN